MCQTRESCFYVQDKSPIYVSGPINVKRTKTALGKEDIK